MNQTGIGCLWTLINLVVSVSSWSLPQNYQYQEDRKSAVATVANQIENHVRYHQIENDTYTLNYGPLITPNSLAQKIIEEEFIGISLYANADLELIAGMVATAQISNLDDYAIMYNNLSSIIRPPLSSIEHSDASFGEDRLSIRGFRLQIVEDYLLKDLGISEEEIVSICDDSVFQLMEEGRYYTIDLTFASEYNDKDAPYKYVPGSQAFFCINHEEKFLPIGIYISDTDLMYTPFDTKSEWEMAKMGFAAAEINVQQFDHFVQSHLVIEQLRVEMMRHISPHHPVYPLLEHHMLQIFSNTVAGFQLLFQKNTTVDVTFGFGAKGSMKFCEDGLKQARFDHDFEAIMADNSLNSIPHYKYRDDARRLINGIDRFLREYLKPYYSNNDLVKSDYEIQNWAMACSALYPGFPGGFQDLPSLIKALSNIIFRTSVFHHALNSDTTWDVISLPYNVPALMYPLPTTKGEEVDLFKFLYPKELQVLVVALAASYKRYMPVNITLLDSYNHIDLGEKSAEAIQIHNKDFLDIKEAIAAREEGRKRSFYNLSPENLPHYVWV